MAAHGTEVTVAGRTFRKDGPNWRFVSGRKYEPIIGPIKSLLLDRIVELESTATTEDARGGAFPILHGEELVGMVYRRQSKDGGVEYAIRGDTDMQASVMLLARNAHDAAIVAAAEAWVDVGDNSALVTLCDAVRAKRGAA
jgi:hypothetical protein